MQNKNIVDEKMSQNQKDTEHTNEYGDIEVFKDTKYWFKRDIQTIKKSFIATFKFSHVILLITFVFSFLITRTGNTLLNFDDTLLYTAVLSPIFLLGYFIFYVIATKGYDIESYEGTHINIPEHARRFSIGYILRSNMSAGRKALFLLRLAFYIMLIIGLLLNAFAIFKK